MTVEENKKIPYNPGPNAFDITPNQDGGVLKEIIKPGIGEYTPTTGCNVSVHYVGTLTDGTGFDSSRKRNEPFSFVLGKGSVIKAWDIGVATMKKGEICMLTCRSEYAYGKSGSPPLIQPDATLLFEIEMLEWQAEDLSSKKDGGILRTILRAGDGHSTPNEGSTVNVHVVCEYDGKVLEDRDVSFCLGEGSEEGIPSGVERALDKFKLREKSLLQLSSQYGWGSQGKPELGIPPNAKLNYTVTLNSFEKLQEHWELDADAKLEQGKLFKEKGAKYFKAEKYSLALKMYKKMIDYLDYGGGFDESEDNPGEGGGGGEKIEGGSERTNLTLIAHLNAAACYLKLQEHLKARDQCDKALALNPKSDKGLFRRGQAYLGIGEPGQARADFEALLKVDPNNKAAMSHIQICSQKLKEQKAREKKIYANMFDKFAQRDREKEEEERKKQPDVMKTLGEWGQDEREREPTDFEKENPNILMLEGTGDFKNM
ncbi:FK506-binding protein 59-like isoform X2 [Lycorma delicatula]|uniref:FK506-binding protein 59-like isoform X2 n=1 Tax=Lycorma delicatula TaxID=130591 RepID=UPI003F512685